MERLITSTIGEIVTENFKTAAVFKKYGIDFCCKGGRTITEACEKKNVDVSKLHEELEETLNEANNDIDFTSWPLDLLADYVEKTHHRYVNEKTLIIQNFLDKLCKVHGNRHSELFEINELFNQSAQDLAAHLKKEELILFPFIRKMVAAKNGKETLQTPHFGTVENPIEMMKNEHVAEGERFEKIAQLTSNYTPPTDACNTYRVTFSMLQDFENDLHKHIHLENNILFPKSIKLEQELAIF